MPEIFRAKGDLRKVTFLKNCKRKGSKERMTALFEKLPETLSSTRKRELEYLLSTFPDLVKIGHVYENGVKRLELRYFRKRLLEEMSKDTRVPVLLTSFERGLKHNGMEVCETTHGGHMWKRWQVAPLEKRLLMVRQKKKQKRERRNDQDGDDPDYVHNSHKRKEKMPAQERRSQKRAAEVRFNLDDGDLPEIWKQEINFFLNW